METIKAYCNTCCGERNHEVLHKEKTEWSQDEDYFRINGDDTYYMIKCCGCEHIEFKHDSYFSGDLDDNGNAIIRTMYYPPATFRNKPRWLSDLSWFTISENGKCSVDLNDNRVEDGLSDLINEIYIALQNNSTRLAVMGARALIEHVMIHKVGDNGNFNKNLTEFEKQGFISKTQRQILEPVIDAGSAAMHRSYKPSIDDVVSVLNITESIIETLYVNVRRAQNLKNKVPVRQQKKSL